jgi:hypothetical protein
MIVLSCEIEGGAKLNIPPVDTLEGEWLTTNFSYLGLCRRAVNPQQFILIVGFKTIQPTVSRKPEEIQISQLFRGFYPLSQA